MSAVPPVVIPAPPAHVPGGEPRDDDPPSPTYLGVGPGADWHVDGGHESMTDDEPYQDSDGEHADALGTVVVTTPQQAPGPGL